MHKPSPRHSKVLVVKNQASGAGLYLCEYDCGHVQFDGFDHVDMAG